jgi:hypothetical protein
MKTSDLHFNNNDYILNSMRPYQMANTTTGVRVNPPRSRLTVRQCYETVFDWVI